MNTSSANLPFAGRGLVAYWSAVVGAACDALATGVLSTTSVLTVSPSETPAQLLSAGLVAADLFELLLENVKLSVPLGSPTSQPNAFALGSLTLVLASAVRFAHRRQRTGIRVAQLISGFRRVATATNVVLVNSSRIGDVYMDVVSERAKRALGSKIRNALTAPVGS